MEECLENFVGEEFRVLSYQIVRNELFTFKQGGELDEELNTSTSPLIPDPHQQMLYVFGMLEPNCFSLYKDMHLQTNLHSFSRQDVSFVDLGLSLYNEEK